MTTVTPPNSTRIISAAERSAAPRGVKALIVGPVGVGKTSLLRTTSLASTLFIDIEAGDLAVQDLAVDTLRPRTWPECRDIAVRLAGADPAVPEGAAYSAEHYAAVCSQFDTDTDRLSRAKVDFDDVIKHGAPEGDRSGLFQACVWHLATKGMKVEEIAAEFGRHINGIGAKYADRLPQEVERSYAKWQQTRTIKVDAASTGGTGNAEPNEPASWDEVGRNNKPRPTRVNARRAINALNVKCRYDAFHDRLIVEGRVVTRGRANLDHVALELREKIHRAFKFDPGAQNIIDALTGLCLDHTFDPVVDYLAGLTWDGTPRLDRWLITYCGAEDTELNREFGRLALIAAVRRARRPGAKFDPIIVLEGAMGTGKSKAIEILAGSENFSDQAIFGARDREQQELLAGVWLFEIAELSNIRRTEVEHIKAFASRTHDRARPAYGRTRVDQPRRCVIFATTNDDTYLKEPDRRFWPVKTDVIDTDALRHDRDQLWAEAAAMEPGADAVLASRLWKAAGVEQEARREHDPWDDKLAGAIGTVEQGEERVASADLLEVVLGIPVSASNATSNSSASVAVCAVSVGMGLSQSGSAMMW